MSTKIPPSSFCLGQLFMDMGPFQSVANIFSVSPLENTNFPSANGLSVVDSFFVKNWTLCPLTTFSTGTLSRWTLVQVLCMLPQSLSSYVHWSCCVQMTVCLAHTSDSYYLSASYSLQLLRPRRERFDETIPFRTACFKVAHSVHGLVVVLCVNAH